MAADLIASRIPPDPVVVFVVQVIRLHSCNKLFQQSCRSGILRALGTFLGATLSGLRLSWMPLGAFGEGLEGLLGSSWSLLGGSRGPLGATWGPLGAVLGPLGMVLGVLLPQLIF